MLNALSFVSSFYYMRQNYACRQFLSLGYSCLIPAFELPYKYTSWLIVANSSLSYHKLIKSHGEEILIDFIKKKN